ncbi:MAG: tryptophan--tRNA ligase, partial [Algiphilus sp.]|nr:tryptophan--tRNA ligase [Algiphilus sp.]
SKSEDAETNAIYLLDEPKRIERKIKRAVTDMEGSIRFDQENKPGVSNLMSILAACTGQSFEQISAEYDGGGYGQFKKAVADAVIATLEPLQQRYAEWRNDEAALRDILRGGAQRAQQRAQTTVDRVHAALGFIPA